MVNSLCSLEPNVIPASVATGVYHATGYRANQQHATTLYKDNAVQSVHTVTITEKLLKMAERYKVCCIVAKSANVDPAISSATRNRARN